MTYLVYLLTIGFIVGVDQISKQYIVSNFDVSQSVQVIKNFFYITYERNTGAAFSILQNQQLLFFIVTPIAILILGYILVNARKGEYLAKTACLFMIGGAIGNFIDRLSLAYVVDFLDFYIFGYNFAIFNVADSFLTVGVILFVIALILEEKNAKN